MYLCITGFFSDEHEDDSLQFELDVAPEYQQSITDVLGWGTLIKHANGELRLTDEQVGKIEAVLNKTLPKNLILFIGVEG